MGATLIAQIICHGKGTHFSTTIPLFKLCKCVNKAYKPPSKASKTNALR